MAFSNTEVTCGFFITSRMASRKRVITGAGVPLGANSAGPDVVFDVLVAELDHGRDIGKLRRALAAPIRQQPRGAALHMGMDRARRLCGDVDLRADECGERRPAAAIGHVQELDAGGLLEHLERDVRGAVIAGRAERNLSRPFLGVGHEVGQRLVGRVLAHREHARIGQHAGDRHELIELIGWLAVVEPLGFRQKRHRGQRHQQRVAVGLGARRCGIADHAARAGAIVDDRPSGRGSSPARPRPGEPRDRPARRAGMPRSW